MGRQLVQPACSIACITFEGAANETGTHADMMKPLDWMESNVSSDERRVEEVITFQVFVDIANKFLKKQNCW